MRPAVTPHTEFRHVSRPLHPGEQIPVTPSLIDQLIAYRHAASRVDRTQASRQEDVEQQED